jgi:hypothetical protein
MGALLVVVAVTTMAFALGGNDQSTSGTAGASPLAPVSAVNEGSSAGGTAGAVSESAVSKSSSHAVDAVANTSGVAATRVVTTGQLSLTVAKGQVAATIASLTSTTTALGGYVSQSRTEDVGGAPTGSVTLRIPVNRFEDAITAATKLGHETSLNTEAHDVTGQFVDISARLSALKRTRATYLTILSRARTIGQTLSVQQRVNDIQQQIESLQGQLKVLRNQSADGTLAVDVSGPGEIATTVTHHHRGGWSTAWHNSTGRFNRGLQAIIGGLGPLLLALLLMGVVFVIASFAARRLRRRASESVSVVST